LYDTYQQKVAECNLRIEAHLKSMEPKTTEWNTTEPKTTAAQQPPPKGRNARGHRKQLAGLSMGSELYRIAGVDLTQIDGIQIQTAQTVISEVGVDMSRWKSEKQFASWLGLCPDNRISGGKVLKRGTRHVVNRAATALRMSAWSLFRSQSALGANFRRLRRKLGAPKAVTAMAHKLARLVYRMLKFGQGYVDKGMEHYEAKYRLNQIKWLAKSAAALNLQLIPLAEVID
jgi:transposase